MFSSHLVSGKTGILYREIIYKMYEYIIKPHFNMDIDMFTSPVRNSFAGEERDFCLFAVIQ